MEVTLEVHNTNIKWLIAILSVEYKQDLARINEALVNYILSYKLLSKIEVLKDGTLKIHIWDLDPEELMDKLGFDEEQRLWAELLYTGMMMGGY